MADNAIEKLFEEMRAAKAEYTEAEAQAMELRRSIISNSERQEAALKRVQLLERTLNKHIHDGMPIVQAKMVAHEEQLSNSNYTIGEIGPEVIGIKMGNHFHGQISATAQARVDQSWCQAQPRGEWCAAAPDGYVTNRSSPN